MEEPLLVYLIGFLSQICYSARILFQWILSERAKRVLSPAIFWYFSLLGAYLMFIYGCLRNDFALILGPLISYYIYVWNLNVKGNWDCWPRGIRWLILLTPVFVVFYLLKDIDVFVNRFFCNEEIPIGLLLFGSLGQMIMTLRFVYQWFYSKHRNASLLPMGFWVISLVGALVVVAYGIYRYDPVLILGQVSGLLVYSRNIYLACRSTVG